MDEFRTIAKLWPNGADIDLGTDSNVLGGPATFTRNAADFVTSPDGTQNYQFLFWNTGRHTTNKRRVRWNFSVLGWGTWTATRWYGTPPGIGVPGGPTRVRADAFSLGSDSPLTPGTPIDAASTYAAGAWPSAGDDHVINTTNGPAHVVPKDPFPGVASSTYEFAGWLALQWGGDPSGEFVENDSGTSGGFGSTGYYSHVAGGAYDVAQGVNADIVATYGTHHDGPRPNYGRLRDLIYEILTRDPRDRIKWNVDPSPEDYLRLKLLGELLENSDPKGGNVVDFQQLISSAATMSREELTRSMQDLRTSMDLGKSAMSALEAQMKRIGK